MAVMTAEHKQNLTVWTFPAAESARRELDLLRGPQRARAITIDEAAVIEWPPGRSEPETREFYRAEAGGDRRRIWRTMLHAVFDVAEAPTPLFRDLGVNDRFLGEVREHVQPGTSMLFVLTTDGFYRDLEPSSPDFDRTLLYTTLPERAHAQR
jgi:uncharacterized membrane protein